MKRPLMGLGIALTAGVAVGWSDISWLWICTIVMITSFILKRWTDSSYKYMLGLFVFFIVGLCRTIGNSDQIYILEEEIFGTIQRVQEKEKVCYLFVEDTEGMSILVIVSKADFNAGDYYKGQVYHITGKAEWFESPGNPGQFDEAAYYESQGISYRIWAEQMERVSEGKVIYRAFRWLEYLKNAMCRFYEVHMNEAGSSILQAAVLGERSGFDEELKTYYQENGWMHLVTTSGLHLSFVAMNVYKRLRKMTMPQGMSTVMALCLMLAYGYMTDFGDSMLRAMGMMILGLAAKIAGRRTDGPTGLAGLSAIMLFLRPARFLSVGFLLTFAAVAGMELGQWFQKQWIHEKTKKNRWKKSLCIQAGIFVTTLPILLWHMYEIPVFGFFYNFFMIPLISVIVPIAFVSGVFGVLKVPILKQLAGWMLKIINALLNLIHLLPSKVWVCGRPGAWQLLLFVLGILIGLYCIHNCWEKRGWLILLISCSFLMFVRVRTNEVIFVDVGQGDGICVLTDTGQAFLVDGGSSDVKKVYTYRLEALLKYYGIDQIDAWFLTHGDMDHISGVKEALEEDVQIGRIFLPDVHEDQKLNEIRVMAEMKNISVIKLKVGSKVRIGAFETTCLYPMEQWCTGDSNNDSLVLRLEFFADTRNTSMLLTGDIEEKGEKILMDKINLEKVDILKVAHHGSSGGTTSSFLEAVQPKWAIISCGANNRYGHPHEETLERLENEACKWVSTAKQGAVHIHLNEMGYEVFGYQKSD